jgi:hypothetical protein
MSVPKLRCYVTIRNKITNLIEEIPIDEWYIKFKTGNYIFINVNSRYGL